jgi:SAM-dependent methyltransferase
MALRGVGKGAALAVLNALPSGPRLYRHVTRELCGTQATHVDKLRRVLPGYLGVWRERCGLRSLEGLELWVHEAGYTPFWGLASYLLTGKGGVLTNADAHLSDRYLARAVNGVLAAVPKSVPEARRRRVEALRWHTGGVHDALRRLGTRVLEEVDVARVPLGSASVDLVHSGGALEHCRPDRLRSFLEECRRVLRPGGIASHVLDHRDHLHHADRALPFLAHLALPALPYRAVFGGPLTYHNRLAPAAVCRLFEESGFERIVLRRLVLPEHRYRDDGEPMNGARAGLSRRLLAPAFRGISEDDLHTAAAHYVYRRG